MTACANQNPGRKLSKELIWVKDKESLDKRNRQIIDGITALLGEKSARGSPKYTMAYIYDTIGEEYDLQSRTVRNIFIDLQLTEIDASNS